MSFGERNLAFDGLRGVAALAVLGFHIAVFTGAQYLQRGYLAVDLFFVLSGTVIASAYGARLADGLPAHRFFLMRLARLYPLFAIGATLGIARIVLLTLDAGEPISLRLIAVAMLNALMLPAPLGNPALYPVNIPAWSLFFELVINVAYAFWLFKLQTRTLLLIVLASGAAMIVGAVNHGTLDLGVQWATAPYGLARAAFAFPLGMVIARLPRRLSPIGVKALLLPAGLALALALPRTLLPSPYYDLAFALIIAPLLVWSCVGLVVSVRLSRPLTFLGAISYPLYAVHFPLAALVIAGSQRAGADSGQMIIAAFAVPLLAAVLLERWFDRPVRRWLAVRIAAVT